ncbi:Uncharacterised protein [Mycobacteroides abscessus subsp. abscessus]|nr:Uncharacterised protein [Mycobacteroides abscessus subsp. abscessus]
MRGSAMLTTVASSEATEDPRMVASRIQRPVAECNRGSSAGVLTAPR